MLGVIYVLMDPRIDNESRIRYLQQLFKAMTTIGGWSPQVLQTGGIWQVSSLFNVSSETLQ